MTPELARLLANPALVAELPAPQVPALLLELAGHQTQLGAELERAAALSTGLAARLAVLADSHGAGLFAERLTITAEELAAATGRTVTHIRRLCRQGGLRARRVGKYWSIPVDAARAWAAATDTEINRWLTSSHLLTSSHATGGGPTASPAPGPDASCARPAPRRSRAHRHPLGDGRAADPSADGPAAPAPGRRGRRGD